MHTIAEWVDARTAAIFLKPCTPKYFTEQVGPFVERKSSNRPGTISARSGGWLYHRSDLERLRAIMNALGCRAFKAAWILHSVRELNARNLLPYLSQPLSSTAAKEEGQ